jgi:hypothetical protein
MKVHVDNDTKKNKNRILNKTENKYGYRKKKNLKQSYTKISTQASKQDSNQTPKVTESMEIRQINETKRSFYRKIGCLVELESSEFNSKASGSSKGSKPKPVKKSRTKLNQSERNFDNRHDNDIQNFQSSGVVKKKTTAPRFKTKPVNNIPKVKARDKRKGETAEERKERIKAYKKMRFVGLKSKKKPKSKKEFGTGRIESKQQEVNVSKTTPINFNKNEENQMTPNREYSDTNLSNAKSSNTPTPQITPTRDVPDENKLEEVFEEETIKHIIKPEVNESPAKKLRKGSDSIIEEQKQKILEMSKEKLNIEIQSCRIERNVEKLMFETGSAKNLDIEVQNEIEMDCIYTGMNFPTGLRSPSDVSNDFRSESTSRLKMFDDVPVSMQSNDKNLNIEDLRNFHKKGKHPGKNNIEICQRKINSMQDNMILENRRLTLKETKNSSEQDLSKFKKNYSNTHLTKKKESVPKEDFLDPKFDCAIPRITRMIQNKGPIDIQGSESLDFLLTSNAERPRLEMLNVKELTSDMDMIINGIDSLILTKPNPKTLRSRLSEGTDNFEYSKTNVIDKPSNSELTNILKGSPHNVTNLVIEEIPSNSKISNMNDEEIKKMKKDLNLKGNTQDIKEYLSLEVSATQSEKHPFLKQSIERDRAELRQSLEKYAANLERIEEEENACKEESYIKERALKMNEDPLHQMVKFDITKESLRKSQKPPLIKR